MVTLVTGLGLGFGFWLLWAPPQRIKLIPDRTGTRGTLFGLASLIYLAAPLMLMNGPFDADNHSVRTLRETDQRIGRSVRLDRQAYFTAEEGHYLVTYAGEKIRLDGPSLAHAGRASIEGVFVTADLIRVTNIHQNQTVFRDYASIVGLLVLLAVWIRSLWVRDVT